MADDREEPKLRMICEECGSSLVTRDAWAEWNEETQDWQLGAIYDFAFCHDCGGETHIEEKPLEE